MVISLVIFPPRHRVAGVPGLFPRLAAALCVLLLSMDGTLPAARGAASPALDNLIARLPKPESFTKSPLESALKDPDPILRDPAFQQLGVYLRKKDNRRALESARGLAAKYPQKAGIHLLHGVLALEVGLYPEAEGALRRTVALEPQGAAAWQWLALSQAALKHYGDGVASARQAVKTGPKREDSWATLSLLEARAGHPGPALEAARQTVALAPRSPVGRVLEGSIQASQRQFPLAIRAYKQALVLAPDNDGLLESEAVCYAANNQPKEAVVPLERIVGRHPRAYQMATFLGACYLKSGDAVRGGASCRQALATKSDYAPAWKLLGLCYTRQGKNKDAAAAYQKAVKFAPNDAEAKARLVAISAVR